ncbi:cytosine permease (plasmid) [Arsenophonus nasoniae]|uniref:Cytosine permease n=1 Tax=Arsenophonus nasoniae TaxID=638 RepID=A0A4P7KZR1_9GAMM|nr:cytosine permease [Arsenophonus nasoniae]QBY45616.1 Cytosine permease [Arsenophonus nasoniae]WGM07882.1 cytosine permease [Arsenophonus nasoniae]WGM12971.1 cytosine permease [Arsenophonus nasoniae]WGM17437.1 cytosine permease [Arsenophonus nasoniae]
MSNDDSYSLYRVPHNARLSFFNVTLIRIGQMTSLSQFMLGAMLGHSMTFEQAMIATLCGTLILEFLSLGLGIAGAREGLSISLLSRWTGFGRLGSAIIGSVIAISLLGWFGIQNSILAKAINYSSNNWLGFNLAAIISGLTLTALVAFGVKALNWTAKISVPLFCVVVAWIFFLLVKDHNISNLITTIPSGTAISITAGITAVAGGCMTSAFSTPDISRYCQSGKHVFWMTLISILIGEFIVNGISILIAHALDTDDVVTIMGQTAGWIGLLSVILSALKINDLNLYSSSLGIANAIEGVIGKKLSYSYLTIMLGILGTTLSVLGMLDRFVDFLVFLGVLFPPIIGVILIDYYMLKTSRKILDKTREKGLLPDDTSTPLIGWTAILACVIGSFVGATVELGIPSLNSLLVASIIYWVVSIFNKGSPQKT